MFIALVTNFTPEKLLFRGQDPANLTFKWWGCEKANMWGVHEDIKKARFVLFGTRDTFRAKLLGVIYWKWQEKTNVSEELHNENKYDVDRFEGDQIN